jgi:hypothetical protein
MSCGHTLPLGALVVLLLIGNAVPASPQVFGGVPIIDEKGEYATNKSLYQQNKIEIGGGKL